MWKLLEFREIGFTYPRQAQKESSESALWHGEDPYAQMTIKNVSFAVQRGEWVALLGANGSGKSTLARLANGLLLPNMGEVVADGVSSWQHDSLLQLRKLVGLVTQDPDNQIVSTTVFDEIAFGPQNLGWAPERIRAVVPQALAKVGLDAKEFLERDPNTLSGGEKQRVVIAAVLAMEPHYLVLDEPTAMLDPQARAQVLETIAQAAGIGHGILHITHLLREASFANRVLVLHEGLLAYDGPPQGILGDEEALIHYGLWAKPAVTGRLHPVSGIPSDALDAQPTVHDSLQFQDVSFSYPDDPKQRRILERLDLTLGPGDCLLLMGASGSGKSTILSLAAGLLEPTTGKVFLKGEQPKPGQMGILFQQPEDQLFAKTLSEDILFGPKNLGMVMGEAAGGLVDSVLSVVGLAPEEFRDRSPFSLSGGEARRAAIATALALWTEYLLLDEPTAGLDAQGKVFIYELIQGILAKGKGVIIATHDPGFFASLATSKLEL